MRTHRCGVRRVAGFSAVGAGAAAGLVASPSAAEVVYTPLDVNIPADPNDYHVDLNSDGLAEFDIQQYFTVAKVIDVADGTSLVYDPVDEHTANLATGTLIGPDSLWGPDSEPPSGGDPLNGTVEEPADSGMFEPRGNFQVSDGPGYIGVRFSISGSTHYGYVGYEGTGVELDPTGHVFAVGYETVPDTGILAGAGAPSEEDADFDADGDIDGEDFLIWQRGLGSTGQTDNANGDADGSGTVDAADLESWKGQFGAGGAAVGAVPEPTSLSLLAAGAAGVAAYRRRRR